MASTHRLTAILDLKDRLTGKLKNATKQTGNYRDANGRLRDSMHRFTRETDKASRAHDKFTRNGVSGNNRMRTSTMGLATAITGIVTTIMSAVGGAKLLKTALSSAMEFEMNEATITAMFQGDTKGANDYISMISNKALGSPLFNESDYFQNSKTFLTATKDLGELDNMWDIAERLAAMDPFQGLDGAAFAMRELFSGDALSMQKRFEMPKKFLNSIKNLPIAEQLKKLDEELTKMGFGKDFLDQISDTGLAYKNQIEETFEKGLREVGAYGLEALKPHMKEFLEMLDTPAFETFKKNIGETFGKALGKASQAVMYIVKNWGKISPILESIGVAFATAFAASKIAAIAGFVTAAGGIGAAIAGIFSPILLIVAAVGLLYYAFKTNMFGFRDIVTKVFDYIKPYVADAFAWMMEKITPFVEVLKIGFENAKVIIGSFFKYITGDKSGAFKDLTERFGLGNGAKIYVAFGKIKDFIKTTFETIKEIIINVSGVVKGIIEQYWPIALQVIQRVMENIVPFLQNAWIIISNIFMTVMPIIIDLVKIAWDFIKQIIEFVMPYVLTIISTVWNTVISVFTTVWNYIAEVMPMIKDIIVGIWTIIEPIVVGVLTVIWHEVKNAFTLIWNIVSWVMTTIGNVIEIAWIFISGLFKAVLQVLTGDFSGAWETLKETAFNGIEKIKETIGKWVDGALKIGKDFVQGIIDGFLNKWNTVVETAQGIWDAVTGIFSKKQTINVDVQQKGSVSGYRSQGMSHSGGLDYVPYDRYPALLHRGERVLTKQENDAERKGKGGIASIVIAKLADTIVVREDADIDKIANKIADAILEAGGNGA